MSNSKGSFWKVGILAITVLLNVVLFIRLTWGMHSIGSYRKLCFQHQSIIQEIGKYKSIVEDLSYEIQLLQSNPKYMENVIRQHLNFLKDNEILYFIINKKDGISQESYQ